MHCSGKGGTVGQSSTIIKLKERVVDRCWQKAGCVYWSSPREMVRLLEPEQPLERECIMYLVRLPNTQQRGHLVSMGQSVYCGGV